VDSAEKEALRAEVTRTVAARRKKRAAEIRAGLAWLNKGQHRWEATTELGTMVVVRIKEHSWISGRLGDKQSIPAGSLGEAQENIVSLILHNTPEK
jgi:hypothetical protein